VRTTGSKLGRSDEAFCNPLLWEIWRQCMRAGMIGLDLLAKTVFQVRGIDASEGGGRRYGSSRSRPSRSTGG